MGKLKAAVSRILLLAVVLVQVFGTAGIPDVQASTSAKSPGSIIVSGGTFDTGMKINQDYSVEMTFSLSSLDQYRNLYIAKGEKYDVYRLRYEKDQGLFASHGWYNQGIYKPRADEEVTVGNKKNVFYVNGRKALTETYQTLESVSTLKFGDFAGSIRAFRVWDASGALVASYSPAVDGDGKACMYDTVGRKYVRYSGKCTAGKTDADSTEQDRPDAAPGVRYAEALKLGGGTFDTGLTISQDHSIEMVFSLASTSQYKNLYNAAASKYSVYKLRNEAADGLYVSHGWYNQKIYTPKADETVTISQKKNITYVNGRQAVKMTLQKLTAASTLKFGDFSGTVRSFRVWDAAGKLAGEFLPAADEAGKACMYDTVSGRYIKYSGTCSTVGVEDKKEDEPPAADTKAEARKEIYEIVKDKLVNNNPAKISLEKYNMTKAEVEEIIAEVREDYYLESAANTSITYLAGTAEKCTDIQTLLPDKEYSEHLSRLRKARDKFLKTVKPEMSDMDKVLLAHEYLINNCVYDKKAAYDYRALGSLGYGKATCVGYARGIEFLLHYMDIETEIVGSTPMNHGWLYVKIDGEWYHIDATWDDTRKGSNDAGTHRFFIRNDKEMMNDRHYGWKTDSGNKVTSASTKYTKWFVHDVAGRMHYYKGMWYYFDLNSGSIKASTIEGKNTKTIVSKSEVPGISKIYGFTSDGVLEYCANGKTRTKKL